MERRILDAANGLFLSQGYGRTTMDQIVPLARTSKSTLYGRYPTKADLFVAVVRRSCADVTDELAEISSAGSRRQRLVQTGCELAARALTPEALALMRVTAAEAETFPQVAKEGFEIGFGTHVRCIAEALSTADNPQAVAAATPTAIRFVELALHPLFMHGLFGADLDWLRRRAPVDIQAAADIVLEAERRC